MGEGFARFKRQFLIDAIVKSCLVFIGVALLVIGTFLIVIEKSEIDFDVAYAVLIGIASGLLLGIGTFFVFHLSGKRLAKRLDKIFGLNEKVQTMYAFREEHGSIKELQRADAKAILNDCKLKMSKFVLGWAAFIAFAVLSLSLFVYSVIAMVSEPATSDNNGGDSGQTTPSDPPVDEGDKFEPTEHHRLALLELIEYVRSSQLQEGAKASVVAELELLLSKLDTFETDENMKAYVVGVINNVRESVNSVNTTYELYQGASQSANKYLSKLNQAIFSLSIDNVRKALNGIFESLCNDYEAYYNYATADPQPETAVEDQVGLLAKELVAALEKTSLGEDDDLYSVLSGLSAELDNITNVKKPMGVGRAQDKIREALLTECLNGLKIIVPPEKINEDVKVEVVNRLEDIFGLEAEDEEDRSYIDDSETADPNDKEETGDDGGFGTGDMIFGSNDLVIDPEKEPGNNIDSIKVEYGEIIARYDAEITRLIESGEISEEIGQMLREYFEVLMTPKENKE